MRISEINMMHIGSTGRIMFGIADTAVSLGHEGYTFSPYYYRKGQKMETPEIPNHFYFGSLSETKIHHALAETTGLIGFGSYFGTIQLIRRLKEIKPDILHLHNLHNFTINIPALFSYIRKEQIQTIWTLHDCWSMTGKCPHFEAVNCDKWKEGCYHCPAIRDYPKAYVDQTKLMWRLKRRWFTGLSDLTIVTPSQWLAGIVKGSYMSEYPVQVINNGIDLNVFQPTTGETCKKYGISPDRYVLLGVAFDWDEKKGIDVFIKLANRLPEKYQIVLVGTNSRVDALLPPSICAIHRTQNQHELAEIYSRADVFINPTREDTFPTVNIEALACGTPVITFKTGGSPESIDSSCGFCVACNDIDQMEASIIQTCEKKMFSAEKCIEKARNYDMQKCFAKYVMLYEKINRENERVN